MASSRLHLDEIASLCCGFGKDAMVDSEEGEFEAIGDSGLVVDDAQVILDDLLFGPELHCDVLVLASLHDEGNNLHLLRRHPVSHAGSDVVRGLHGGDVDALYKALSPAHSANAVHQIGSSDVAA